MLLLSQFIVISTHILSLSTPYQQQLHRNTTQLEFSLQDSSTKVGQSNQSYTTLMDSRSPKRLAEFLLEQQEPFILELYLRERRHKRSMGFQSRRVKRSARYFSRIARDVFHKLVSTNEVVRLKGCDVCDGNLTHPVKGRRTTFSSPSFLSDLNSSSGSDTDEMSINGSKTQIHISHQTHEVSTGRCILWRMIEENKQRSPVSVLDEIEPIRDYHVGSRRQEHGNSAPKLSFTFQNLKKATEESIFSASLWNLFIHNRREETRVACPSKKTCSEGMNSKRALHQTRQILFDCVKETVESRGRQRKMPCLIGTEELGKVICNNIRVWEKQFANGKKIAELLRSDLHGSYGEENIMDGLKEEVVKEVGDKILEDIKDEVTNEIIDFFLCKT